MKWYVFERAVLFFLIFVGIFMWGVSYGVSVDSPKHTIYVKSDLRFGEEESENTLIQWKLRDSDKAGDWKRAWIRK